METNVLLAIISIELLVLVVVSIYFFIKRHTFFNKNINNSSFKNSFNDIIEYSEKSIDSFITEFYDAEILRNYFKTNNTLGTNEINKFVKDIYISFLNTFPKGEFDYYNKITNYNYDKILIKLIHKRILKTDVSIKSYHKNKGL